MAIVMVILWAIFFAFSFKVMKNCKELKRKNGMREKK